jgi:hypothetical protein
VLPSSALFTADSLPFKIRYVECGSENVDRTIYKNVEILMVVYCFRLSVFCKKYIFQD